MASTALVRRVKHWLVGVGHVSLWQGAARMVTVSEGSVWPGWVGRDMARCVWASQATAWHVQTCLVPVWIDRVRSVQVW